MSPIVVALDFAHIEEAEAFAGSLAEHVAGFKVGLELLMGEGPEAISRIGALGRPVMVDAKLCDIPRTAGRAAVQLAARSARWVTAHASGGFDMLEAVVAGLREGSDGRPVGMLAVTVLTSLDHADLSELGVERPVESQVAELARLAARSGAEGIVCAVDEVAGVKTVSESLVAFTPGIRLQAGTPQDLGAPSLAPHDQKRTATPLEAMRAGADFLVIGRPITTADDPVEAIRSIIRTLEA